MVLEKLGDSLKKTLSKIASAIYVDEKLINELVKDIQRSLLQSDVNVKLVFDIAKKIKKRASEEKVSTLSKKDHIVHIVYEELVKFLGGEEKKIDVDSKKPFKIMLVGLFGNGKTTTAGKLAKYYQKRGKKVALISTDTWRPAAFSQLKQLGESINAPVFGNPNEKDPVKIYKSFEKELYKHDLVIIDTAGRDALSEELIKELNNLSKAVNSDENILVIGADIGQAAEKQAKAFHEACGVNGVIITKLEGTAKGGGSLSACSTTGAYVKFIGVGEKIDDLEEFNPTGFVGRILGMGDLEALLNKAKYAISEEDAQDLGKRFLKGDFNLIDLYEQMRAMKKMGPLNKIVDMMPGMGQFKIPKEALSVQEEKLIIWKHIMDSCTKKELKEPDNITGERIERISHGSGASVSNVRELIKQYRQSKKIMKMFKGKGDVSKKGMEKMMKRFGGGKMKGMPGFKF